MQLTCNDILSTQFMQLICINMQITYTYTRFESNLYVNINHMCVTCGLPTTHTMSLAQWLAVASLMSFGALTFISCWWVVSSHAFRRKIRSVLDHYFPHPTE